MLKPCLLVLLALIFLCGGFPGFAHNLSSSNASFVASINGPAVPLFMYLGAKHMVTGTDHVLYLLAVVFMVYQPRQIIALVSLFALGHSLTLVLGVWLSIRVNPGLVDALIGLSIVYKALENLGGLARPGSALPSVKLAVFGFGLVHGLGLATRLQAVYAGGHGLLVNLISFNAGVELGQLIALSLLLALLVMWRRQASFGRWAVVCNLMLLVCGFAFAGYHWLDMSLGAMEPGVLTSGGLSG